MAFGGLKGFLEGGANSITNPAVLSGSVVVAVGDLVFVVVGQQTGLTATAAADNLTNTYVAQNVGTDPGSPTGIAYYSRVTVAGTLTTINVTATASANDWSGVAGVIEGPFVVTPIDTNPANSTADATSPFSGPATGTLAQAQEAVLAWASFNSATVWTATSPNLLARFRSQSANVSVALGYQAVAATTTVTPVFASAANPASVLMGTASFKKDLAAPLSGASSLSATTTGNLTATSALSGASAPAFSTAGNLQVIAVLAGAAALNFATSGEIAGTATFAGSTSLAFAPSADLKGGAALSASSALAFSSAGNLAGSASVSAASVLAFAIAADLTTDGGGGADLAGVLAITFSPTGAIQASATLSGLSSPAFLLTGAIAGSSAFSGTSETSFAISANLAIEGASVRRGKSTLSRTNAAVTGRNNLSSAIRNNQSVALRNRSPTVNVRRNLADGTKTG